LRVKLGDAVLGNPDEGLRNAVGGVLVGLDVPAGDLPVSLLDRKNTLLTKTFPLSVLLVLEDVANPGQIEPFLLNSPESAVVVVCRAPMLWMSQQGFRQFTVAPLDDRYGVELFDRMLGPGWCSVEGADPLAVARACGGYPLAITTTAAQIAMTPEWDVPELIRRLAERGLSALDIEAQQYVLDSFDRAYDALPDDVARAYRLVLGLHPGREFDLGAATALLDEPPHRAGARLAVLVRAQLLTQIAAERYRVHDVAHWHARDRAEEREAALGDAARRVVSWYLDLAVRHDLVLSGRPRSGPRYRELNPVGSRAEALSWLETNRASLCAAVGLAERHQHDDLVWQLCEALWGVLHLHGHHDDWITTHRMGVAAADRLAEPGAAMRMSSQLGAALLATGDFAGAREQFEASLRHARDAGHAGDEGDASGEQSALEWLGKVAAALGDLGEAQAYVDQSWQVTLTRVDPEKQPRTFALLRLQRGRLHRLAGHLDAALAEFVEAGKYFETTKETDNKAKVWLERGRVEQITDDAASAVLRAQTLFAEDGSLRGEAGALELLLEVAGNRPEWTERLGEIYRILGDPRADG
jgi:tetratricopeptide (TPR) repeat protein